jgi:hypothetical protein
MAYEHYFITLKYFSEITKESTNTDISQKYFTINYGAGYLTTHNLCNCLVFCGRFEINGRQGTFMTHDSPLEYIEHIQKLEHIKKILDKKQAKITKVFVYVPDHPASDIYSNNMTTTDIIKLLTAKATNIFGEVETKEYQCDSKQLQFGSILFSPTVASTTSSSILMQSGILSPVQNNGLQITREPKLASEYDPYEPMVKPPVVWDYGVATPAKPTNSDDSDDSDEEMDDSNIERKDDEDDNGETDDQIGDSIPEKSNSYYVLVLKNEDGNKIYKCPKCKVRSGTFAPLHPYKLEYFCHNANCINIGKIPVEYNRD